MVSPFSFGPIYVCFRQNLDLPRIQMRAVDEHYLGGARARVRVSGVKSGRMIFSPTPSTTTISTPLK